MVLWVKRDLSFGIKNLNNKVKEILSVPLDEEEILKKLFFLKKELSNKSN